MNNVPSLQGENQWVKLDTDVNTAIQKRLEDILRDWDDYHKLFQVVDLGGQKYFPSSLLPHL